MLCPVGVHPPGSKVLAGPLPHRKMAGSYTAICCQRSKRLYALTRGPLARPYFTLHAMGIKSSPNFSTAYLSVMPAM